MTLSIHTITANVRENSLELWQFLSIRKDREALLYWLIQAIKQLLPVLFSIGQKRSDMHADQVEIELSLNKDYYGREAVYIAVTSFAIWMAAIGSIIWFGAHGGLNF